MARKTFRTDIELGGRVNPSLKKAQSTAVRYLSQLRNLALTSFGVASVSMAIGTVKNKIMECVEASKKQIEAETKLKAALANNINLRKQGHEAQEKAFHTITNEASWLQKIGVIGDEITLAGQQQLATYQLSDKQIARLSAGMNDLVVKMHGVNATQENAVAVAKLMGNALSGNAGALKRYGIIATKAEEAMLKNGNQAQRVATLQSLLARNVGGVNRAMANTPQGKIQQASNLWGDMQETIGMRLVPVLAKLSEESLKFLPIVQKVAFAGIDGFMKLFDVINATTIFLQTYGEPIFIALSGIIGGLVTFKTIQGLQMLQVQMALAAKEASLFGMIAQGNVIGALKLLSASVWKTVTAIWAQTAALLANPITWIVVGVAALTAGLVALALNWDKVTAALKNAIDKMKAFLHLKSKDNGQTPQVNEQNTQNTPHHALGTHNFVGGETYLNESGQEKAILPRGTEILSHNKSVKSDTQTPNMNISFTFNVSGSADASTVQRAISSAMPSIKSQIDAYFRQKQRLGYSF